MKIQTPAQAGAAIPNGSDGAFSPTPFTPGEVTYPIAPRDPGTVPTDGVVALPYLVQGEADLARIQKRGK